MPIVRIEMWTGRTHAQKQELAKAITEAVCAIARTTPDATIIVFRTSIAATGQRAAYWHPTRRSRGFC